MSDRMKMCVSAGKLGNVPNFRCLVRLLSPVTKTVQVPKSKKVSRDQSTLLGTEFVTISSYVPISILYRILCGLYNNRIFAQNCYSSTLPCISCAQWEPKRYTIHVQCKKIESFGYYKLFNNGFSHVDRISHCERHVRLSDLRCWWRSSVGGEWRHHTAECPVCRDCRPACDLAWCSRADTRTWAGPRLDSPGAPSILTYARVAITLNQLPDSFRISGQCSHFRASPPDSLLLVVLALVNLSQ